MKLQKSVKKSFRFTVDVREAKAFLVIIHSKKRSEGPFFSFYDDISLRNIYNDKPGFLRL